jgi:hypothetical protein
MAIQVTNFTTNWKYGYITHQLSSNIFLLNATGSYILVSYENTNSSHINIIGKLTNTNDLEANVLDNIIYHSIEPNESDLLNFSHNYIINHLTTLNPGVTFTKIP